MKHYLNKILIIMIALGVVSQAQAYTYSFTNHTSKKIAIGMKYKTSNTLNILVIAPHTRDQFKPGDNVDYKDASGSLRKSGLSLGKAGYLPSQWLYLVNPTVKITHENKVNLPWRAFHFTYIKSDAYDVILNAAEAIGNLSETIIKTGVKGGVAYATGGASLAAESAADTVKATVEAAAKKTALKGETLKEFANADYNLGKVISDIGNAVGHSMMRSFHTDIIEDENGDIKFITLL